MPVDPSIPLSYKPNNFMEPFQQAQEIKRLENVNKLSQLELQDAPRQIQQDNAMFNMQQQQGQSVIERNLAFAREHDQKAKSEAAESYAREILPVMRASTKFYRDLVGKGASIEEATKKTQEFFGEQVDDLAKGAVVQPQYIEKTRAAKFNPFVFEARSAELARFLGEKPDSAAPTTKEFKVGKNIVTKQWDPEKKTWVEMETAPRSTKGMGGGGTGATAAGVGLPKGVTEYILPNTNKHYGSGHGFAYELGEDGKWKPISPSALPQKLVKVGSVAAGQGAREAVFTQRKVGSASQAAADLENIVALPITAERGAFQFGTTTAPSFLDATKVVIGNKMTSESGQIYNRMAAGLQRSLATIEAQGLMPSGSLTHQMDAVLWKPGDTTLSKMHALAQIRQIIDSQMKVELHNPRISDDEKELVKSIIAQVHTSVPFTHLDLIELGKKQGKNPNATLRDLMKKGGKTELENKGGEAAGGKPKSFSKFWAAPVKVSKRASPGPAQALSAQGEDQDEDSDGDKE